MRSGHAIIYAMVLHLSTGDVQKVYRPPATSLETPFFAKNGNGAQQDAAGKSARRDPRIPLGYQFFPPNDAPPSNGVGYDYSKPQADVARDDTRGYTYGRPESDAPQDNSGYAYDRPRSDPTRSGDGYAYGTPQSDAPQSPGYNYDGPRSDAPQDNGYGYERPDVPLSDTPSNAPGYGYDPPGGRRPAFGDPIPTTRLPEIPFDRSTPKALYEAPAANRHRVQADPFARTTGKPSLSYFFYEPPNDPTTRRPVALADPAGAYVPPNDTPAILQDFPLNGGDKVPSGSYLPPPDPPILQDFFANLPGQSYLPPADIVTVDVPDFRPEPPLRDPANTYVPPAPAYIPPDDARRDETPSDAYLPPSDEPRPSYVPPAAARPQFDDRPRDDRKYLPAKADGPFRDGDERRRPSDALQIQIVNMSCMRTPTQNYFRATLRTTRRLDVPPIVENLPSKKCVSVGSDSSYGIDLSGLGRMADCGVRDCSGGERDGKTHVCARVRFPTVRGLKLPEDVLLTLQCKAQDRVVSQTKYLAVNPTEIRGRSAQTAVATGGRQHDFTTNVALLRRSSDGGDFNAVVRSGGAVLLGEELMLRANVKQGDGWRYSRFADVTMHRVATGDRASRRAVTLLDRNGCRNPHMRSVCPSQQAQDRANPLASHLPLRAFVFQDMASGDEMVLSVRLIGCLEHGDCFSEPSWPCGDGEGAAPRALRKHRSRRDAATNRTADWRSYLEFKVIVPNGKRYERIEATDADADRAERRAPWVPFVVAGLVLLTTSVLVVGAFASFRRRYR